MAEESGQKTVEITGTAEELREIYGMDTARAWATQVQFFLNEADSHVLLVFREGIPVTENSEEGTKRLLTKNVASVVLPMRTARSLGDILVKHLGTPEEPKAHTDGD